MNRCGLIRRISTCEGGSDRHYHMPDHIIRYYRRSLRIAFHIEGQERFSDPCIPLEDEFDACTDTDFALYPCRSLMCLQDMLDDGEAETRTTDGT